MNQDILKLVEKPALKTEVPQFEVGDTVDVHTRILEGEDERIQIFSGTVISMSGSGSREMFTVRRIVAGEGVERSFPLHSPKIAKVEVKRTGVTRRAKLYYLRDRVGKATRLRERKKKAAKARVGPGSPEAPPAKRKKGRRGEREREKKPTGLPLPFPPTC